MTSYRISETKQTPFSQSRSVLNAFSITKCYRVIDGICFLFSSSLACLLLVSLLFVVCLLSPFPTTKQIHFIQAIIYSCFALFSSPLFSHLIFLQFVFFSFSLKFGETFVLDFACCLSTKMTSFLHSFIHSRSTRLVLSIRSQLFFSFIKYFIFKSRV